MAPSGRHSIAIAASRTRCGVQELNPEPPHRPGAVAAGRSAPALSFFLPNEARCLSACSAKHGQSPTDPNALARVPDSPIISAINAAWTAAHPGAGKLVIFSTDDDGMLLWLSDRSQAAADFVKNYLLTHSAAGNNISGNAITVSASGLTTVYAGAASAAFYGVSASDPRHPDVTGIAQHGVVYTGGQAKIAEHGGDDPQDRNVPILVVTPSQRDGRTIGAAVETTQIAPTILALLGLNPDELQAVQIEHTQVLPALRVRAGF